MSEEHDGGEAEGVKELDRVANGGEVGERINEPVKRSETAKSQQQRDEGDAEPKPEHLAFGKAEHGLLPPQGLHRGPKRHQRDGYAEV